MTAILKLTVALLALGVAEAVKCCFPRQFEGHRSHFRQQFSPDGVFQSVGSSYFAYDAVNKRQAFRETMFGDGVFFSNHIVKNHATSDVKYFIDDNPDGSVRCSNATLEPFPEKCIEDSMEQTNAGILGLLGGLGTPFAVFNSSYSRWDGVLVATLPDENGTCLPLLEITGSRENGPFQMALMPYNITLGIKDESVFDVPDLCYE